MVNLTPVNSAYDIMIIGELAADGKTPVPLPSVAFIFSVSDPTLGIFTVNADGKSGVFVSSGKAGSGSVMMIDPVVSTCTAVSQFSFVIPPTPPSSIQFTESAPHPGV